MPNDTDEMFERKVADNPTCASEGHDWSHTADRRVCRRCSASSSYGSDACYGGHDWCHSSNGSTCRRCSARITEADREAALYGRR